MLDNCEDVKKALNNIYENILMSSKEELREEFNNFEPSDITQSLCDTFNMWGRYENNFWKETRRS